ncbi:MAG TPA: D-aminoacylase [Bryobacteraceae bacterium]|nr:D-aminoacylase [Bryobacteraceae bacterium]
MRLILAILLLASSACAQEVYDVILSKGKIVDGTGNAWFFGDVAISGNRIARIAGAGLLDGAQAKERIDARGLVVAPGFVDIQGALGGPAISKITQGVTTEIAGEGWTEAPSNDLTRAGTVSVGRRAAEQTFDGPHGFDEMLRAAEKRGSALNFGSYVGATTIRQYVKGMAAGKATPDEIRRMQELVELAMEDGAFGIGSALIYPPATYVDTDELAEITKPVAKYRGLYISHIRSEADQFLEALDEAIEIGRRAGTPVEIYHLKAAGKRNWPKEAAAIQKIADARQAGQDVSACMYPYTAGATGLTSVLPPWTAQDGKLLDNLADPAIRERIKHEMAQEKTDWENMGQLAGPENILIVGVKQPANQQYAGKRLNEIAAMMNKDWRDAAMDLILSERTRVDTIYFLMSEENIKLQLRQPWIKFGIDGRGLDPEEMKGQLAHPRAYGTFPRVLGLYVREQKVLPLEDAIRKMTSAATRRLGIRDRGILQEGLFADIAVFNPDTITDHATFADPNQLSTGVEYVFVNGIAVVRAGKVTGERPGVALRGPGYPKAQAVP